MIKLIWRFALLTAVAAGFAWLADRPGVVMLRWLGREIEMPLYIAVAALLGGLLILWLVLALLSRLFRAPGAMGEYFRFRRTRRGYESLSKGIIAAGAGDASLAAKHADIARRTLTDEPLVRLLDAQSAQLRGDRAAVKRAFEAMLATPDTEALGLRGLYAEARQAQDWAKAREYAERAIKISPTLAWASSGLLALQSSARDWAAAEATLETQRRSGAIGAEAASKLRAALLAARALDAEESDRDLAFDLATRAQKLDPALVPAASVAARENSRRGSVRRAMKVLRKTWEVAPHPDLATLAAHARAGDQPEARLERVRSLLAASPGGIEGAVALARAAVEARQWQEARNALLPYLKERPQARICVLMAEIEEGENGDKGRAREWLSRALRAPRDPAWTIDGVVVPRWTPVSPVSGELGQCEWKTPLEALPHPDEPEPPAPEPDTKPEASEPASLPAAESTVTKAEIEPPPPPAAPPVQPIQPATIAAEPTPSPPPSVVPIRPVERPIMVTTMRPPDDPGLGGGFEDPDQPRPQRLLADG
jgi:HemY protein